MIDLEAPLGSAGGLTLVLSAETDGWYALPTAPRISVDTDGAPAISLIRYGEHAWFEMSVELGPSPRELAIAEAALTDAEDVRPLLGALPVAAAEIDIYGLQAAEPGTAPLHSRWHVSQALQTSPHRAHLSARLTPDAADTFAAALTVGSAPVGVSARLTVMGRQLGRGLRAYVDWRRVHHRLFEQFRSGRILETKDVAQLTESLLDEQAVQIVAVDALASPELSDAERAERLTEGLLAARTLIVEQLLVPVETLPGPEGLTFSDFSELVGVGQGYVLREVNAETLSTAVVDLQRMMIVPRILVRESSLIAALPADFDPASVIESVTDHTHPFFQRWPFRLNLARPLGAGPILEVVGEWIRDDVAVAVRLTAAEPQAALDGWAGDDPARGWQLTLRVVFRPDAPIAPGEVIELPPMAGATRTLTVDVQAALGLRAVTLPVTWRDDLLACRLVVQHHRGDILLAQQTVEVAAAEQPPQLWLLDARGTDRVQVIPEWFFADGTIFEAVPYAVEGPIGPVPLPTFARVVEVIAESDFTNLDRVHVEVGPASDPSQSTVLHFEQADQVRAVRLDFTGPQDRMIRYQTTRTWDDGRVEQDPWLSTDRPLILAGRQRSDRLAVTVQAVGPAPPAVGLRAVEVELMHVDPVARVERRERIVLVLADQVFEWLISISHPDQRAYRYRITRHGLDGREAATPWTETEARLLPVPIVPIP